MNSFAPHVLSERSIISLIVRLFFKDVNYTAPTLCGKKFYGADWRDNGSDCI